MKIIILFLSQMFRFGSEAMVKNKTSLREMCFVFLDNTQEAVGV